MTAGDVRRALLHGTTSELIKERLELVKEGSFRQARAISACACAGDSTLGEEKLSWDGLSGGGGGGGNILRPPPPGEDFLPGTDLL